MFTERVMKIPQTRTAHLPSRSCPEHNLDRQTQSRQLQRRPVRPVAVRACTIDDKQRALWPRFHPLGGDLAPW